MTTNWNFTSDLVADRRAARESAAQRHRLLSTAPSGTRFFHRRQTRVDPRLAVTIEPAAASVTAPTTGPTPQRAAA